MAERYGAEIDHPKLASAADLRSMHSRRVDVVVTGTE